MSNCCYVFLYFYYVFILDFYYVYYYVFIIFSSRIFIMFSFSFYHVFYYVFILYFYCLFHISHFVFLLYFHFVFLLCVLLCFHFIFYVFILSTLGSTPITQISYPLQPKFLGPIWPKTKAFFTGLKPTKEASLAQGQAWPNIIPKDTRLVPFAFSPTQPNSRATPLLSCWFLLLFSHAKWFFLHCQLLLQSTACTQQLTTPTFCTNTWSSCIFVPEQANSNPASPARTAHLSRPRQLISFANLLYTLHEPLHGQLPASSPG